MARLVFVLFLVAASKIGLAQTREEQKVWAQVERLTRAIFETKDSIALDKLVSEGVSYGHSNGDVENKGVMIQKAVANGAKYRIRSFEKVAIQVKGKTAIVRHNFRANAVDNGKESLLDLGIFQVWKKEGRQWRLWARQAVKIPAQVIKED